jgi:succinate dehydrogenase/fumarate reductase flavoprotein subunit
LSLDGAVGFSVRDPEIYVFKARAAVCTGGGAINIRRPHAVGEGGFFFGATMPSVLALMITG